MNLVLWRAVLESFLDEIKTIGVHEQPQGVRQLGIGRRAFQPAPVNSVNFWRSGRVML